VASRHDSHSFSRGLMDKAPPSKGGDSGFESRLEHSGAAEFDRRDRRGDPQGQWTSSPSPWPLGHAVSSVARRLSRRIRFAGALFSLWTRQDSSSEDQRLTH
jgi:hypothetical protein